MKTEEARNAPKSDRKSRKSVDQKAGKVATFLERSGRKSKPKGRVGGEAIRFVRKRSRPDDNRRERRGTQK